ncbi:STELLO glycosyltransferase family protein [Bacteroidota bacterium]
MKNTALVVTSISSPNPVLKSLAEGSLDNKVDFYVIGDTKSPATFELEGCKFYSMESQLKLDFKFAHLVPEKHYARKNIGYLLAIQNGASTILETDDDNFPRDAFWGARNRTQNAAVSEGDCWLNAYTYFTDKFIWPRGFSLEHLQQNQPAKESFQKREIISPVQQGLADENPDVDAIFRLAYPLPLSFEKDFLLALGKGSWCPFNSQNTTWFKEAFPLMYLPSYCSFRMTDIWRSFVAQRIMWENDWHLLFHKSTVWQDRNEHDLMKDFKDEIPGYLNNDRIVKSLEDLELKKGQNYHAENLVKCYQMLVDMELVGKEELKLVDAWNEDMRRLS